VVFAVRGGVLLAHNTVCLKWVSRFQTDTSLFPCTADMIQDCSVGWHIRRRIRVPAAHKQTTIYLYIILFSIHSGWYMNCGHYCRDNLLGLCDQKSSNKYGSYSQCLWCYGRFLILTDVLLWTDVTPHGVSYMLYDREQLLLWPLKGRWCKHISQLSTKVCLGQGWDFQKPTLSTNHCKFKAVSCLMLTLYIRFIM